MSGFFDKLINEIQKNNSRVPHDNRQEKEQMLQDRKTEQLIREVSRLHRDNQYVINAYENSANFQTILYIFKSEYLLGRSNMQDKYSTTYLRLLRDIKQKVFDNVRKSNVWDSNANQEVLRKVNLFCQYIENGRQYERLIKTENFERDRQEFMLALETFEKSI